MPYALIPDGYTLKKVTKAQEKALKDKQRHDNVTTFLNNPELMKQLIITISAYLVAREGLSALRDLKALGVSVSKDVEEAFTKKRTFGDAPVAVSIEQIVDNFFNRLTNLAPDSPEGFTRFGE